MERVPTNDLPHAHVLAHAHFTLRDDGTIQTERGSGQRPGRSMPAVETSLESSNDLRSEAPGAAHTAAPRLLFQSDAPFIRLCHGNSLELLDAIAAKYHEGRFDCIFADPLARPKPLQRGEGPPYFLSNGGITCHAGKMVKVDKLGAKKG